MSELRAGGAATARPWFSRPWSIHKAITPGILMRGARAGLRGRPASDVGAVNDRRRMFAHVPAGDRARKPRISFPHYGFCTYHRAWIR